MAYPVPQRAYTIDEIFQLSLEDSPDFGCTLTNPLGEQVRVSIQDSHLTQDELKTALSGMIFIYIRTTFERIPVFTFIGSEQEFRDRVHVEVEIDPLKDPSHSIGLFCYPKNATPRQQYYTVDLDGSVSDAYGKKYIMSMKLKEALEYQDKGK